MVLVSVPLLRRYMHVEYRVYLGLQWLCVGSWNSGSKVTPLVLFFFFSFWLLLLSMLLLFLSVVLCQVPWLLAFLLREPVSRHPPLFLLNGGLSLHWASGGGE